jgi:hypothetical protein
MALTQVAFSKVIFKKTLVLILRYNIIELSVGFLFFRLQNSNSMYFSAHFLSVHGG